MDWEKCRQVDNSFLLILVILLKFRKNVCINQLKLSYVPWTDYFLGTFLDLIKNYSETRGQVELEIDLFFKWKYFNC